MRSWRRGIREMDLILGGFADAGAGRAGAGLLDAFEMLLSENDHDLYRWIAGSAAVRRHGIPKKSSGGYGLHHRIGVSWRAPAA